MGNYVLAFHGGGPPETEEAQAQVMQAWGAWYESLGSAVVDSGNPIGRTQTIGSDGSVAEGGGDNPVTGYSIVRAESMDAAVDMAKACPHLQSGGTVEVGETYQVM